jgi:hypothetical protein
VPQSLNALIPAPRIGPEAAQRHREVQAQLRALDYWRRLVNARLDLAVAAVADIDDDVLIDDGLVGDSLRELVGIPRRDGRLAESAKLILLREVLKDLDAVRDRLRCDSAEESRVLIAGNDPFGD